MAPRLAEKVESRKRKTKNDQSLVTSAATEGRPVPVIISTGEAEKNRLLFSEHRIACPILLQKEMEVATAYRVDGTPSGCLVNADGKIASELAVGADAL